MAQGNTPIGFGYGPFVDLSTLFHALDHHKPVAAQPRCRDACHDRFHHDPRAFAVARLVESLEHQAAVRSTSVDGDAFERAGVELPAGNKTSGDTYKTWPALPHDFDSALAVPALPDDRESTEPTQGYNQLTGMPRVGGLVDVLI